MAAVQCIETTKGSWLKVGMILRPIRKDCFDRYYFRNGGVAASRLFKVLVRGGHEG